MSREIFLRLWTRAPRIEMKSSTTIECSEAVKCERNSAIHRIEQLQASLLQWYRRVKRDLPWRATKDPYRIWISQIMLQQTRVALLIPSYERFLARFPDVESLANAPEANLLAMWAGLGYYSRPRHLQKAAHQIAVRF